MRHRSRASSIEAHDEGASPFLFLDTHCEKGRGVERRGAPDEHAPERLLPLAPEEHRASVATLHPVAEPFGAGALPEGPDLHGIEG